MTGGPDPERVRAAQVTPALFSVLQVPPLFGRTFTAAEGLPGRNDAVVLGFGLWQRRFGGDATIVGREIQVNGRPYTVLGIMPASFKLPMDFQRDRPTELWLPFVIDPANLGQWGNRLLLGVGRLRPDTTPAAATTEFRLLWKRWIDAGAGAAATGNLSVSGGRRPILSRARRSPGADPRRPRRRARARPAAQPDDRQLEHHAREPSVLRAGESAR